MALSERERQMLEEMEEAIRAEDPRFASQMNGVRAPGGDRRRMALGIVGALAGLGLVLLGINTSIWVGVAGFALIVASVALALTPGRSGDGAGLGVVGSDGSVRSARTPRSKGASRPGKGRSPKSKHQGSFMQRMEARWEERRQQGQGW
ncbi:DUF3040 domain-containing protein [Janibacter indicus]|uniref:DUF3040 domain-containing protein n=1 Tax=Janibacter indicus TaxID=857417 RepID=A0A1L3MG66_9MICO|nr:DUF3040 domain-containing protein [Janibacter indicus]APH01282.1 hypothetical protein ASJ30_06760 [Janibacter indicus]QOK24096.1 DUF3040 domain-containing protein [Janibacter indicus]